MRPLGRLSWVLRWALAGACLCPALWAGESFESLRGRVVCLTYANGLRVLMCPQAGPPVVWCATCIGAGSGDELPGASGVANLCARLAYQGIPPSQRAEPRPKGCYSELFERLGAGRPVAIAGPDLTVCALSLPADKLDEWAALEAQRLAAPCLDGFEAQKLAALEERSAQYELNPFGRLYAQFLEAALGGARCAHGLYGARADLLGCMPHDLVAFRRAACAPNRIVLAIVGGFVPEQIQPLLGTRFGPLPPAPSRDPVPASALTCRKQEVAVEFPDEPILLAGYPIPPRSHSDTAALEVLTELLGAGAGSRLQARLARAGLVRSARTWLGPGARGPRLFILSAEPARGRAPAEVQAALSAEVEALKAREPSLAETQGAARACQERLAEQLSTDLTLAVQLAEHELLDGTWQKLFTRWDELGAVTPARVRAVAAKYLDAEACTSAHLVWPAQADGTGAPPLPPFVQGGAGGVSLPGTEPLPPTVTRAPAGAPPPGERLLLDPEREARGKKLLAEAIEAAGGLKTYQSLRTLRADLLFWVGANCVRGALRAVLPGYLRADLATPLGPLTYIITPGQAWKASQFSAKPCPAAEVRRNLRAWMLTDLGLFSLIAGAHEGYNVQALEPVTVEGRTLEGVLLEAAPVGRIRIYFDAQTKRLAQVRYTPDEAVAEAVLSFSGHAACGPLKLARRLEDSDPKAKAKVVEVTGVELNPVLPGSLFNEPRRATPPPEPLAQ